jgi:DNA-binding transcriptional MerR regulator
MSRAQAESNSQAYTLPQLAELSGIDYRTLHNWQKRGTVRASQEANGSGSVSLFAEVDARHLLILAELRRAGVEMRVLETVADSIWELARDIDDEQLLVVSEGFASATSHAELSEHLPTDRASVIVRVGLACKALTHRPPAARHAI